jgi:hypothetical protein
MTASQYVHVEVDEIIRATDDALLVKLGEEEVWIPRSQIADDERYEEGDLNCTVSITKWIANRKGIDYDD